MHVEFVQLPLSEQSFGQSDVNTSVSSSILPSDVFLNEEMLLKIFATHDVCNAAKLPAAQEKSSVAFDKSRKIFNIYIVFILYQLGFWV